LFSLLLERNAVGCWRSDATHQPATAMILATYRAPDEESASILP
jgi:hypothetical protein